MQRLRLDGISRAALAAIVAGAAFAFGLALPAWSAEIDAHAEVAAALYAASATQAASERALDTQLRALRGQVAVLSVKVKAGEADKRAELAQAQDAFVTQLAAKDAAYAQEIAVLRGAVTDIASTPEGAKALAEFNDGDELGGIAVLDRLRAARDQGRRAADAAEGRRIAELALEARSRGKLDTASVIARYENVTSLDPAVQSDWLELDHLYRDAGRLADALKAAQTAVQTAADDQARSVALKDVGDVLLAQDDPKGAGAAYDQSIAIDRRLVADDPRNRDLRRDLMLGLEKRVDIAVSSDSEQSYDYFESEGLAKKLYDSAPDDLIARRDYADLELKVGVALYDYDDRTEAIQLFRDLATGDPESVQAQRDLAVALAFNADFLRYAQPPDLAGARPAYDESLGIFRRLLAADPTSGRARLDVAEGLGRVGIAQVAASAFADAHASYAESVALVEKVRALDASNDQARRDYLIATHGVGVTTALQGDIKSACRIFDDGVATFLSFSEGGASEQNPVKASLISMAGRLRGGDRGADGPVCGDEGLLVDAAASINRAEPQLPLAETLMGQLEKHTPGVPLNWSDVDRYVRAVQGAYPLAIMDWVREADQQAAAQAGK